MLEGCVALPRASVRLRLSPAAELAKRTLVMQCGRGVGCRGSDSRAVLDMAGFHRLYQVPRRDVWQMSLGRIDICN